MVRQRRSRCGIVARGMPCLGPIVAQALDPSASAAALAGSAAQAHCGRSGHSLPKPGARHANGSMKMAEIRTRPLSPHLQIYRPMLTMLMSVAHRVTGAALYFGTLFIAWWLIAAASGPNYYAAVQWFMATVLGRIVLFGYTWALIHHMLGGVRHLIWDTGHGFGPQQREWMARATIIGSVSLTLVTWLIGYLFMGGAR